MDEPEVELPWIDEPLSVSEAVEVLARATEDDAENFDRQLGQLRQRVEALEDGTELTCPYCGETGTVVKAGVAAAQLVDEGSLTEGSVDALNRYTHVCMDCRKALTPHEENEE